MEMRGRWMTWVVAPVAALSVACSDGTDPGDGDLEELVMAFCADEMPVWFAFQNEGQAWTRVLPTGGAFTFDATPRVGIALTYDRDDGWFTDVYYTTVDEIRPLSGVACTERSGTRDVAGSVAGVAVGSRSVISLSGATDTVTAPSTGFSLTDFASNPQDLIAHREELDVNGATPNRVIVRRAQDPVHNSTLSTLDFSTEGQAAATHTATITGLLGSEDNYLDIFFETATGTQHDLYKSPFFTSASQPLYGIPSGLTQAGDAHEIRLNADGSGSYRSVVHWTRVPGDKAFTLGPALASAAVEEVASAPYARLRVTVNAQAEYPSFATAFFDQGDRLFVVTVTAGYIDGTITAWAPEVPDLTAAGNFPTDAGLENNTPTDWFIEVYAGDVAAYVGGRPMEGETVTYAGRSSSTSTIQMSKVGERTSSRTRLLRRAFSR
jgi:hypothetical protein